MKIAEVRNLRKEYPKFKLQDISFALQAGEITGFIGRNGAGKTTTIKSMLNLVHPDSGEVFYFGLPLLGNEDDIKQRIGYSTGAVNYYQRKRIRDILSVTKSFYTSWDDCACLEYMDTFSLDETKTPAELSEGMKVKLNLLLALSHKAELLILDEPTGGLDPFSRDELLHLFVELRNRGVAILFSTHITSDLEKCADNIAYIRNGELLASCSKDYFRKKYGQDDETLEETILRLERGGLND